MVQCITTHEEDLRELFVVIGHHSWARCLLGHRQKIVDIFNGPESLLPEFELHRRVKLSEASIEMSLQSLRILEVDSVGLVCVFRHICEVQTECFAKATELDFSFVFQAELEGLLCDLLQGI